MTTSTSLAELAVAHPGAARVFHRHRLDFCCGGRRSLDEACRDRNLDPVRVLESIAAEDPIAGVVVRWDQVPLPDLVAHVIDTYHGRLRGQLPELVALAHKVEARHAGTPRCPRGLADHLEVMQAAILDHLQKEETILFPLIVDGRGRQAAAPVHAMEVEHEHHREHLLALRRLTDDFAPPPGACTSWRALYLGIQQLEQELMEHIHLENNVLFRRALMA